MSEQVMTPPMVIGGETAVETQTPSTWATYIPFVFAIVGSFLMAAGRMNFGSGFISDGACMMLALASYLTAAVFYLTNMYAPFRFAEKLGLWATTLGVFFNLSSWLLRWITAYDREVQIFNSQGMNPADMPWVFRYIPFANLYDLSLAFAFGAGVTTLLVIRRKQFRIIAALSLPLAAIILVLARFIGNEFIDLPPVLDSYWRPIHVGIASLSYGIALVCFAVAVLYLLKDGLKVEKMAIWTSVFALAVFTTVSKFSVFSPTSFGTYASSVFAGTSRASLALRADIPYVGWLVALAAVLLTASSLAYLSYLYQNNEKARGWGHKLLWAAMIVQAAGIGTLVYQIKNLTNVVTYISASQYQTFARWMLQQQNVPQQQINSIPPTQLNDIASRWITDNGASLHLSMNANPVEVSALITAFAGTFFVLLFMINTEKLRNALPAADKLDGLMYKLGGVAFAGLALLLMTGAIWANESWGRYWGWDAKEVGALVAWLTYAGFLHSRIAYSWKGKRSAYFAIVAFLFVVFTYLGVSYLLPGLHSYA
jgi:ABC-type transport system involved in cytochrome c biogenesis permease subunit